MHWKAAQKVVKNVLAANRSMRLNNVYRHVDLSALSHEDVDKALAGLVKSGEVVYTRGWYQLVRKEKKE